MRCSAERPRRRTPRRRCARCARLSGQTRASADCDPAGAPALWHGRSPRPVDAVEIDGSMREQLVDDGGRHVQLGEAGPAGVDDQLVAVLVGGQADDARLEPQREVLVTTATSALIGQVAGHREDAVIVGVERSVVGRPASSWWLISTRTVPPHR